MFHIILTVYLCGFSAMSLLMAAYYTITKMQKSVGEPFWKLVFTAVIWPMVCLVLIIDWIKAWFVGKE